MQSSEVRRKQSAMRTSAQAIMSTPSDQPSQLNVLTPLIATSRDEPMNTV